MNLWMFVLAVLPTPVPINAELRRLIQTMAQDGWGAPRVHAELTKLGFIVSEMTVSRYMSGLIMMSHRQAEGGVDSETNRLEASSSVPIGFEVRYSLPGGGSEAIVNVSRSNVDDNGAEVGGNLQILVFVRSYSWSWQPRICELTAPRTRSSARVF